MRFTCAAVADAAGGRLHGPDRDITGVSIDSRAVAPGQLFVPVVAGRDGHDFIADALAAGAVAYVTSREPVGATAIVVDDTGAALTRLGAAARDRLPERVVGVSGAVGKTSTKDLLAAALARRFTVAASVRSFNNELGVPLTLVNAPDGTEVAVVELGSRGHGEITALCATARPTVGVVTCIVSAHTELLGTLDDVARAEGELVEALPSSGVAVLNAADHRVAAMAGRTRARVVTYGAPGADVVACDVALDDELRPSFELASSWGRARVVLGVRGQHQVANAVAAATAAFVLGLSPDEVAAGLADAVLSPWRMELARTPSGAVVVNDAYNANPESVEAALRALARLPATRRIAVLGVMAELGAISDREHARMGALAVELGIDVVAVDAPAYGGRAVAGIRAALDAVDDLGGGDAVLVKASRVAGLERLAAALVAGDGGGARW